MDKRDRSSGNSRQLPHHAAVVCMAAALFLVLLWLGITVIHDSARNSAVIAFVLTTIFIISLYWRPRSSR